MLVHILSHRAYVLNWQPIGLDMICLASIVFRKAEDLGNQGLHSNRVKISRG